MTLVAGSNLDALSGNQVLELQRLLVQAGFSPGVVDGVMGPNTKAAYGRFLSANGGGDPSLIASGISALADDPTTWNVIHHGGEVDVPTGLQGQASPTAAPAPAPAPAAAAPATSTPSAVAPTPTAAPKPTDAAVMADLRARFPQLASVLDNPEVAQIIQDAASGGLSDAEVQGRIFNTNWWKTTSESIRTWDAKVSQDPASTNAQVKAKGIEVQNIASRYGVKFSTTDAEWAATQMLREEWSPDQTDRWFGAIIRNEGYTIGPGSVQATMTQVKEQAQNYLVTMSDQDAFEYATRILEKTTSADAVATTLRTQAANRFYWLKDQIGAGLTPRQLFTPVRQAVANVLEINEDDINLNDPRWSLLSTPVGTGKDTRSMNFWEAQIWARKQPDWKMTKNANDSASKMAVGLLSSLGAIK